MLLVGVPVVSMFLDLDLDGISLPLVGPLLLVGVPVLLVLPFASYQAEL